MTVSTSNLWTSSRRDTVGERMQFDTPGVIGCWVTTVLAVSDWRLNKNKAYDLRYRIKASSTDTTEGSSILLRITRQTHWPLAGG